MNQALYVHLSEPLLTMLATERGELPVLGVHALAGFELQRLPFDPQIPFDWVTPDAWARRQARFWIAVGLGLRNDQGPWQTSFELRVKGGADLQRPCETSLWVKAFAPQDHVADLAAYSLAEMMMALYPPHCEPRPAATAGDFTRLWGAGEPQWLAEVRREIVLNNNVEQAASLGEPSCEISAWNPSPEGLREVWELFPRLPGCAWLSIGVCPSQLFAAEQRAMQNRPCERASGDHPNTFAGRVWLVRVKVGGDPQAGEWLAAALAAALAEPGPTGQSGGTSVETVIVQPQTSQDWQAARFNWQWGEFQPWGEADTPTHLRRLPYLFGPSQVGLLAGAWG